MPLEVENNFEPIESTAEEWTLEDVMNAPREFARVTTQLKVTHESTELDPSQVDKTFTFAIEDIEEEHYSRIIKATEEGSLLQFGWVEEPSMIVIENLAGERLKVRPTEEEQAVIDSQILEVWAGSSLVCFILPGMAQQFLINHPSIPRSEPTDYFIRCQVGTTKYNLTAMPQ